MSVVDDLEYAEDVIGAAADALRQSALNGHLCHARQPFEECRKEACVKARADLAALVGYCRTSCAKNEDEEWMCGEFCGCPGDHDDTHGQERSDD